MPDAAFFAALLTGLTGGVHCIAMCGGFVAASASGTRVLHPARRLAADHMAAQAGRLVTYLALGSAFGAIGGAAFAFAWPAWQRGLFVVANLLLLVTALRMVGATLGNASVEAVGLAVFRRVVPVAAPWAREGRGGARFVLGMVWGLTPCGLIYGVLPLALLSGGALAGAAVMAGLWLGTLPALVLAGRMHGLLARRFSLAAVRRVAATLVAGFALLGLYRAIVTPDALAAGAYCLLP
jgi:sulfite exporter TauE/SafE